MFTLPPEHVYFFYSEYQPLYEELEKEGVIFSRGLPDTYDDLATDKNQLIFIDDLMDEASKHPPTLQLYTRGSHHKHMSVFLLTQNLYVQTKQYRTIR